MNKNRPTPIRVEDFAYLNEVVRDVGTSYPLVRSIYLYGSVARGDADAQSDLDLFFLVEEGNSQVFLKRFLHDPKYWQIFDWVHSQGLEGGLNCIVAGPEELIREYDTLADKIVLEGTLLYGADLESELSDVDRQKYESKESLLDLIQSI